MPSNAAALTRLIVAERRLLLRLVQRIVGNKPAAEDVTQALYLKVQHVEEQLAIEDHRAYLLRMASNVAKDHARFERRRENPQSEVDHLLWVEDDQPSAERVTLTLGRDDLRRVERALLGLAEPTRTMFRLNRFQGFSQRDIAAQFGVSTTIVERHIRRALKRLAAARDGL
jgi:RNA polymerase sigma factor (sigma-70 family)